MLAIVISDSEIGSTNLGGAVNREFGFSVVSPSGTDPTYSSVVKSIGDFDADGYDDMAVGMPGEGELLEW